MGADWYEFHSFLGTEVPLEKVKELHSHLPEKSKSPFKVHICELTIHSRAEFEGYKEVLERSIGFLGSVEEKFSADELVTLRREFGKILKSKQKILKECGIEKTDFVVRAGIHHDMEDYLEYLDRIWSLRIMTLMAATNKYWAVPHDARDFHFVFEF
jgi:hypothetical protein